MNLQDIVLLGFAVVIVVGSLIFFRRRKVSEEIQASNMQPRELSLGSGAAVEPSEFKPIRAHAIVLGDDDRHPGIRIAPLSDEERYRSAKVLSADSGLVGRLSACFQAVPALLVEEGHRGKSLMEVVINGDLVRAKDGVGLRAWTVDANNHISEQAKLFDTNNLSNLVNAAAVWQVASVVVAQKHLADISAKLDDIRETVQDLSHFLDEGRRAKVTGTYEYLRLATVAIAKGELSSAIRIELESCDREMLQVQHHLQQELKRRYTKKVEHQELFGTGDLEKDLVNKYEGLKELSSDLGLTLKTRALAWYVLSLYPGEQALKDARMEGLLRGVDEIETHLQAIEESTVRDCKNIASPLNWATTLASRKTNVLNASQEVVRDLRKGAEGTKQEVQTSQALLLTYDQPTYLVFEVEDGRIGELRMSEPLASAV